MTLEFVATGEGPVTVIDLAGRLDTGSAAEFERRFAATNAKNVVLDLARLDYIGSAGLRGVLGALKRVKAAGGNLAIAAARHSVVEVFEISGFRALIPMHPDRATAIASIS